jgi:hypothetical protein
MASSAPGRDERSKAIELRTRKRFVVPGQKQVKTARCGELPFEGAHRSADVLKRDGVWPTRKRVLEGSSVARNRLERPNGRIALCRHSSWTSEILHRQMFDLWGTAVPKLNEVSGSIVDGGHVSSFSLARVAP